MLCQPLNLISLWRVFRLLKAFCIQFNSQFIIKFGKKRVDAKPGDDVLKFDIKHWIRENGENRRKRNEWKTYAKLLLALNNKATLRLTFRFNSFYSHKSNRNKMYTSCITNSNRKRNVDDGKVLKILEFISFHQEILI